MITDLLISDLHFAHALRDELVDSAAGRSLRRNPTAPEQRPGPRASQEEATRTRPANRLRPAA